METRRNHLRIIGAVSVTCAFPFAADELYAQHDHSHEPPPVEPFAPKFFNAEEGRLVSRMADLIIPPTDTPGAAAAGGPQYIDRVVSQNTEQQKLFHAGLSRLEQEKFLSLSEEAQIALLERLDAAGDAFFIAMKNLTADGYYTSYAGLVQELGYKGNQALDHFEGCVHEH